MQRFPRHPIAVMGVTKKKPAASSFPTLHSDVGRNGGERPRSRQKRILWRFTA